METNLVGTITFENTTSIALEFLLTDSQGNELLLARLQAGQSIIVNSGSAVLNNRIKVRSAAPTLTGDIAATDGDSRITKSPTTTS